MSSRFGNCFLLIGAGKDADKCYAAAVSHHAAGRLDGAPPLYAALLGAFPRHPQVARWPACWMDSYHTDPAGPVRRACGDLPPAPRRPVPGPRGRHGDRRRTVVARADCGRLECLVAVRTLELDVSLSSAGYFGRFGHHIIEHLFARWQAKRLADTGNAGMGPRLVLRARRPGPRPPTRTGPPSGGLARRGDRKGGRFPHRPRPVLSPGDRHRHLSVGRPGAHLPERDREAPARGSSAQPRLRHPPS